MKRRNEMNHPDEFYQLFHRALRIDLEAQAKANGLELIMYNGIREGFAAILKDPGSTRCEYIVTSNIWNCWTNHIACILRENREDWGGKTHYCGWESIGETSAKYIKKYNQKKRKKEEYPDVDTKPCTS